MIRIEWFGGELEVRWLVLGRAIQGLMGETLRWQAAVRGVEVADESVEPRAGDFWIWALPRRGWGGLRPGQVGWVRGSEIYLALARMQWAKPATPLEQALSRVYEVSAV